jgi:hypothetical protein
MPEDFRNQRIKGLPHLTPYLTVSPRIPKELLLEVWRSSCNACTESNVEILFHFHNQEDRWNLRLVEVWLGLLLGDELYQFHQTSTNFYDTAGIEIRAELPH